MCISSISAKELVEYVCKGLNKNLQDDWLYLPSITLNWTVTAADLSMSRLLWPCASCSQLDNWKPLLSCYSLNVKKSLPCSDRCEHTFYGGWPNGWNPSNPAAMQGQCVQRLTLNNTISPCRSGALPCPCLIPALCVITDLSSRHSLTSRLISSSLRGNDRFKHSA